MSFRCRTLAQLAFHKQKFHDPPKSSKAKKKTVAAKKSKKNEGKDSKTQIQGRATRGTKRKFERDLFDYDEDDNAKGSKVAIRTLDDGDVPMIRAGQKGSGRGRRVSFPKWL